MMAAARRHEREDETTSEMIRFVLPPAQVGRLNAAIRRARALGATSDAEALMRLVDAFHSIAARER